MPPGIELEVCGLTKRYSPQVSVGPISFEVQKGEFFSCSDRAAAARRRRCGASPVSRRSPRARSACMASGLTTSRRTAGTSASFSRITRCFRISRCSTMSHSGCACAGSAKRRSPTGSAACCSLSISPGMAARFPVQLSGGQQQRVAIARSLVLEPRILMFDEPLSNLDFKLRIQMREELRNLQRRLGKTAIYVTHDQTEALALSDRIAVLSQGRIEQIGTPGDIYERPATAFVAEFIGSSNMLRARIVGGVDRGTIVVTEAGLRLCCRAE